MNIQLGGKTAIVTGSTVGIRVSAPARCWSGSPLREK